MSATIITSTQAAKLFKARLLDSHSSPEIRCAYDRAGDGIRGWCHREASCAEVEAGRLALSIDLGLSGLRSLAMETAVNRPVPRDLAADVARAKGRRDRWLLAAELPHMQVARLVFEDMGGRVRSVPTPHWPMSAIGARPPGPGFLGEEPFDRARMHGRMRPGLPGAVVAGAAMAAESRLRGGK